MSKPRKALIASILVCLRDLEAMADNAISRFIVLASHRIREKPEETQPLRSFLMAG